MKLTTQQKQVLKAKAHSLRPIILIGNQGVTPSLIKETDRALNDHALIKIRLQGHNKNERLEFLTSIALALQAEILQLIGHIGILYRQNSDKT